MRRGGSAVAGRSIWIAFALPAVSLWAVAIVVSTAGASATPPSLNVSPKGNLGDGQSISVSVGPNSYFTPHARVNILECSDAGGLAANLPKDDTTCDGNTIQGNTIVVGADGSFSVSQYPVYALPSSTLGEQSNFKPVCNQTNFCVLYVGQNQNDFTAPRVFSAPFLVTPQAGGAGVATSTTTPTSSTSGTAAASTSGLAPAGAAGSAGAGAGSPSTSPTSTSGALANTGPPSQIEWLLVSGMALLVAGTVGRRVALRTRQ
jgi:hypothetical protein